MERRAKTELAKAVVQEAVDQCNEIENSLEGCLEVLQNIRMPSLTDDEMQEEEEEEEDDDDVDVDDATAEEDGDGDEEKALPELWKKPSYTVCLGKKYPGLIEIDGIDEVKQDSYIKSLIKFAKRKLQKILQTQRNILHRLESVNDKLWKIP
ncbi:hypothetical protein KR093_009255 [Drosophila rubida]|uniref:Uncharacterized protein n=1 Tax=Drosophila rubida TaxID=30044 RepID=A0AAD4PLT1_9MUSC|nr:hypothetical protein KR093_009255 [Drosophila rubida]